MGSREASPGLAEKPSSRRRPPLAVEGDRPQYGPDGPRTLSGEATQIWSHDRFGFPQGAITPAADLNEAEFLIIPAMQWTINILPLREVDFDNQIAYLGLNDTIEFTLGATGIRPCFH